MQFNQAPAPRESSLGDAYDPTADYSVDDLCIHDNVLYKCITAISGGEAWNSAHWTETNIADEISALNSNIATVEAKIPKIKTGTYSGTANANGDVISNIPSTRKIIGWVTDGAQLVIGGVYGGKRVFTTIAKSGSGQQAWHSSPNESISMTYYYIE